MKHTLTLILLSALIGCEASPQGRSSQSECQAISPGSHYCGWEGDEPGKWINVCCASTNPYCGVKGKECGVGQCCPTIQLDLRIPAPTPVSPIHEPQESESKQCCDGSKRYTHT